MGDYLVTGIAAMRDPAQVTQMLAGIELDPTRLSAVSKASAQARMQAHDEHGGGASFSSTTIMTGSGGTGVPGVGGGHASLSVSHTSVPDYLGGVPLIPAPQAEHFNIAIAEGRTVVMYKATPDEAPNIEAAFRSAGLRNVKVFKPKETITTTST